MKWLREHLFAMRDVGSRIHRAPLSFCFNVLVIALALVLPVAGLTLLDNLRPISRHLVVEPEIAVFLSTDLSRERATAMGMSLRKLAQASELSIKLEFIPRETALASMKAQAGLSDVVSTLGSNPLPDAYVLRLANTGDPGTVERIEKLAIDIRQLEAVETVQLDTLWVKRLASLLQLAGSLLWILGATLCGVVVAVVFNTIRLQIVTHSEEINVSQLLGATDAYVARPFYYTGAMLGFVAGGLSLLIVLLGLTLLNDSIIELAKSYGSSFMLQPLELASVAILLLSSTGLGMLGAALSVGRALRATDQG
jgi:cell division transport system permease protein